MNRGSLWADGAATKKLLKKSQQHGDRVGEMQLRHGLDELRNKLKMSRKP